jgi:tRNA A37 threonylcarbamoyladenosine biosynthesis protein TsaE
MLIAGHYHFSEKWFIEWREKLQNRLAKKSINLDVAVYEEVKESIKRYLNFFGYYYEK